MATKRMTEEHPLTKKLRALEKFMDENHIRLDWDGYHMEFTDTQTGDAAYIRDEDSNEECPTFPNFAETKLTY